MGGNFSLNGAIGQPDAGAPMSGGAFTVSGGFWPGVPGFAVGPLPALSIRLGIGNTVILSWLNPSTGYVLQQTATMSGPGGGWTDVTQPPVIVGPDQEVTVQATGQLRPVPPARAVNNSGATNQSMPRTRSGAFGKAGSSRPPK